MRIVAWNIRLGGGTRRPNIATAVASLNADVLVLSEYRPTGEATDLRFLLEPLGYSYWLDSDPTDHYLGVAMAARTPLEDMLVRDEMPPWAGLVGGVLDGLSALGVYGPGSASHLGDAKSIKGEWWDALLAKVETWRDAPLAVLGDFNTGVWGLDETGHTGGGLGVTGASIHACAPCHRNPPRTP